MSPSTAASDRTLLLSGHDIATLMQPADYLIAVEAGLRAARAGRATSPAPLHLPAQHGGFHGKAATLQGTRSYAALKWNGNFPDNPARGLPTIRGVLLLCDADDGAVLAIMDSVEITLRRTAAATALVAHHLAPRATTLAIIGCGRQAGAQMDALAAVLALARGFVFDTDAARAHAFARAASARLAVPIAATLSVADATRAADVIVTCTTARSPILTPEQVAPGALVAAVGADSPHKSEIAPALMAQAAVVVDVLEQCLHMGDLHHAVAAGVMNAADVRADLTDVIEGKAVRRRDDEIVVFDSTGTALQDVASAAAVYERAVAAGRGVAFTLAASAAS